MKKIITRLIITSIITAIFSIATMSHATDAGSCRESKIGNGDHSLYLLTWETDDGTFNAPTTPSGGLCKPIFGYIMGVFFDGGASNQPDTSYNVYLFDKNFCDSSTDCYDYLKATGITMDGTDRSVTTKNRTPLTSDGSFVVIPGSQVGLYVTGPGAGTRSGTVYLIIKNLGVK